MRFGGFFGLRGQGYRLTKLWMILGLAKWLLGGWAPMTDRYVVNNHGDRKSPKDRVVGPLTNGHFTACRWG